MGGCSTGTAPGSFHRGRRKKGLQTNLQNEIVQEIENLLARQSIADLDLEAVEMAARCQVLRLAARALEQRLNTDTSDHVGPQLPCPCGGSAKYHGRHGKTFESVLGPLHLQRAYYHCEQCESGFCPRDRALGLESFSLTPGVLRMTGSAAALLSFKESSGLLHELAGVEVSAKQVERAAEALGAEIAVDEQQQVEKMGEVAPTMYLGMDGTGVPMRTQEVADRAGKQADGSAKTREAKLVTIWTAESRDKEGKPVRDPGSITYSAAIESAATLDTSTSRRAYSARPAAVVSPKLSVRRCWAMVRPGFGTRLGNYSRKPLRFSTAFMPKNISARWERSFMGTAQKASPGSRRAMRNSMRAA
jgi:hypothetical protein